MAKDFEVRVDKAGLRDFYRQHPYQLDDALNMAALEGKRIVQMSFNTSAAGKTYKRGGRFHVASVKGMPPNIDTGKLMNAIYIYTPGQHERAISTGDTEYAPHLEFGTSKMAPRPFMRPMVVKLRKMIPTLFGRVADL